MSELPGERLERRLLILAPVGKDASLVEAMLRKDAVACVACTDLERLARELERGAAASWSPRKRCRTTAASSI